MELQFKDWIKILFRDFKEFSLLVRTSSIQQGMIALGTLLFFFLNPKNKSESKKFEFPQFVMAPSHLTFICIKFDDAEC